MLHLLLKIQLCRFLQIDKYPYQRALGFKTTVELDYNGIPRHSNLINFWLNYIFKQYIFGKNERKRPRGRNRCRWEDNVKMNLQRIVSEGVD
jgi:hypothetical protein